MGQILWDCIKNNESSKFKTTIETISKDDKYDLNYILNEWVAGDPRQTPLIVSAAGGNNLELVECMINYKVCYMCVLLCCV